MIARPCLDCGILIATGSRCDPCRRRNETQRAARRPPRPHYSGDYARRAARVRAEASMCWFCGGGPEVDNPWQADHLIPGDPRSPLAAIHRRCNIRRAHGLGPPE